ncbi:MAG: type III restriction endonuclease subunit R, partial [Desulfamplus sp.]|nr:type III restriction endonuclease subunit R [Desulfamplus sp.]
YISLKSAKYKIVQNQPFLIPKKSVFNKIICDNAFELELAATLENRFNDVISYAKNTMGEGGINFKIEYQAQDGNIREYYPDFFVKTDINTFFILEAKGREDADDLRKINRLTAWCKDINASQTQYTYTPLYIKQEDWEKREKEIKSFADLIKINRIEQNEIR